MKQGNTRHAHDPRRQRTSRPTNPTTKMEGANPMHAPRTKILALGLMTLFASRATTAQETTSPRPADATETTLTDVTQSKKKTKSEKTSDPAKVADVLTHVNKLAHRVAQGEGTLHKILAESVGTETVKDIAKVIQDIKTAVPPAIAETIARDVDGVVAHSLKAIESQAQDLARASNLIATQLNALQGKRPARALDPESLFGRAQKAASKQLAALRSDRLHSDRSTNPLERILRYRRLQAANAQDKKHKAALEHLRVAQEALRKAMREIQSKERTIARDARDARNAAAKTARAARLRADYAESVRRVKEVRRTLREARDTPQRTVREKAIETRVKDRAKAAAERARAARARSAQGRRAPRSSAVRRRTPRVIRGTTDRRIRRPRSIPNSIDPRAPRVPFMTRTPSKTKAPSVSGAHMHADLWSEVKALRKELDKVRREMNNLRGKRPQAPRRPRATNAPRRTIGGKVN